MAAAHEEVKAHIEHTIERARQGVTEHVDEIDRRLRKDLDVNRLAGEHAPQLIAAGVGVGFLFGFGVPKVLLRTIQIGVPLLIAVQIARKQLGESV
ncbi:MAG: hypothetical protein WBX15_20950 [Thermoanaerobaculia bacterium]